MQFKKATKVLNYPKITHQNLYKLKNSLKYIAGERSYHLAKLNLTRVKVFFVLSMIVPLGLLAGFKFAGVLPEPPTLVTVNTEPTSWEIDRPKMAIMVDDLVEKTFTNEEVSLKMGLHSLYWTEDHFDLMYLGRDGLEMTAFADADMKPGFQASLYIRFCPAGNDSFVCVREDEICQTRKNITVTRVKSIGTSQSEASVQVKATNRTMYFSNMAHWIFQNDNPEDHQLKIVFEFTYLNASIYKKVAIPMMLTILKDAGDTFEDSRQMQAGEYLRSLDNIDNIDMYNITVQEGQTLTVTLTPPEDANYDLYIYNSNRETVANSTKDQNAQEFIAYTGMATQTYFVKVIQAPWLGHWSEGPYKLKIETKA